MEPWLQMVVTIVCAVIASSGFWAFIQRKNENKDVKSQMLIGLAHDRIIFLGMKYIERRAGLAKMNMRICVIICISPMKNLVEMAPHRKS